MGLGFFGGLSVEETAGGIALHDARNLALYLSKDLLPEVRMKDKARAQIASLTRCRPTSRHAWTPTTHSTSAIASPEMRVVHDIAGGQTMVQRARNVELIDGKAFFEALQQRRGRIGMITAAR